MVQRVIVAVRRRAIIREIVLEMLTVRWYVKPLQQLRTLLLHRLRNSGYTEALVILLRYQLLKDSRTLRLQQDGCKKVCNSLQPSPDNLVGSLGTNCSLTRNFALVTLGHTLRIGGRILQTFSILKTLLRLSNL